MTYKAICCQRGSTRKNQIMKANDDILNRTGKKLFWIWLLPLFVCLEVFYMFLAINMKKKMSSYVESQTS